MFTLICFINRDAILWFIVTGLLGALALYGMQKLLKRLPSGFLEKLKEKGREIKERAGKKDTAVVFETATVSNTTEKTGASLVTLQPREVVPKTNLEIKAGLCNKLIETSTEHDTRETVDKQVKSYFEKVAPKWRAQVIEYPETSSNEDKALFTVEGHTPGNTPTPFKFIKDKTTKSWYEKKNNKDSKKSKSPSS